MTKHPQEAYESIIGKIRKLIKENNTTKQSTLIKILNPVIRGWCNYHSTACSKESYQKLDRDIFQALWRWAKRRHPNRAKGWIKDRYWDCNDTRDWIFATEQEKLIFASDTEIARHWLIKFAANHYLREYDSYYLKRKLS